MDTACDVGDAKVKAWSKYSQKNQNVKKAGTEIAGSGSAEKQVLLRAKKERRNY